MSSGCECLFVQVESDKWYYVLEDYNAPQNAWDWREHAKAYGPFATEDVALKHLDDNHSNPGGYGAQSLPEGMDKLKFKEDSVMQSLIEGAEAPRRSTWVCR